MVILAGFLTVVVGLVVTGAGVVGGVLQMLEDLRAQPQPINPAEISATFLEALTKLTNALKDAPVWLALTIVGILLVFLGCFILYRGKPTTA